MTDKAALSIIDITGREISNQSIEIKTGENNYAVSTQGIANGIYFVKVTGNSGINYLRKVIVAR